VDGKYLITGVQPAEYIRILNEVIDMVRKERSQASSKGKAKQ